MNECDETEEYENELILNKSFSSIGYSNRIKNQHDTHIDLLK